MPFSTLFDCLRWASPALGLVRADAVSYTVASASILAKVERDRLMRELDQVYPQYGFARHKGYGAAEHRRPPWPNMDLLLSTG